VKRFAALYAELDASTSTSHKVAALATYLRTAPSGDAAWAVYFLAGGKPRQTVQARYLRQAAAEASGLPDWLFEESYQAVGDLAETIAYVLPPPLRDSDESLSWWLEHRLLALRSLEPVQMLAQIQVCWQELDVGARFVVNKLITGGFRVGVSRQLVIRALAQAFALPASVLAQRIIGYTDIGASELGARFARLIDSSADAYDEDRGKPYPFFLAQSLLEPADSLLDFLGDPALWQVEWKWDGIRAQLIRRDGQTWLWSRGEELISDRFPEIIEAAEALPDGTVLDGEILGWDLQADTPLPFAALQKRIGLKKLSAKVLQAVPAVLLAYDCLEHSGEDVRELGQSQRRTLLEALVNSSALTAAPSTPSASSLTSAPSTASTASTPSLPSTPSKNLRCSALIQASGWTEFAEIRSQSRSRRVEGFMLKRRDASYGSGRTKASRQGEWWKWKIDPLTIDAVLIYAQRGHGRRASLYSDYTFAVWQRNEGEAAQLVPFAKAYSGLSDAEMREVDAVIRKTTIEKFGPVRSVTPSLVFELGFEGISASPRHKSGIAVRFPRMLRLRRDKPIEEANTLQDLKALMAQYTG
jgi:DNA ligase 1